MTDHRDKSTTNEELRRQYKQEQAGQQRPAAPREWQSLIEEQIARIDWSTVAGKGKPLNLERNPYADPDDELAHGLLKNAGFTLPWIEDSRQIDADIVAARAKLARAHASYQEARDAEMCSGHQWIEGAWLAAVRDFRQEAERLNRAIRDFNLKAPSAHLHKFALRIDEELAPYGVEDE
jgi:DnaJ homolog subfamily C member 28